jgi:hypothetical protein
MQILLPVVNFGIPFEKTHGIITFAVPKTG